MESVKDLVAREKAAYTEYQRVKQPIAKELEARAKRVLLKLAAYDPSVWASDVEEFGLINVQNNKPNHLYVCYRARGATRYENKSIPFDLFDLLSHED